MVSSLLDKLDGELNKLGVKYSLTRPEMEEMVTYFFRDLKLMITDPRMPKIVLQSFGTFKPVLAQIDRSLRKFFFWRKSGRDNKAALTTFIRKYWKIRRRLKAEKNKKVTFRDWHRGKYPGSDIEDDLQELGVWSK